MIEETSFKFEAIPSKALFLAYRKPHGIKHNVLPDFFIGAHEAIMQWPILTRDVGRYRAYFPTVQLIAPKSD